MSMCDGLYEEMVRQVRSINSNPTLRAKYPGVINSAIDALREADQVRGAYRFTNPTRCAEEMSKIYDRIGYWLQKLSAGGTDEFPFTPIFRMDSSGIGTGMREFIDAAGNIRPDTQLAAAAREALRKFYVLRPVGSETRDQLEDRIVSVFVNAYEMNWNKGLRADEIIGDANFNEVVSSVSPLTVRLKDPTTGLVPIWPIRRAEEIPWWVYLAAGVGVYLVMTVGTGKKQKRRGASRRAAA